VSVLVDGEVLTAGVQEGMELGRHDRSSTYDVFGGGGAGESELTVLPDAKYKREWNQFVMTGCLPTTFSEVEVEDHRN